MEEQVLDRKNDISPQTESEIHCKMKKPPYPELTPLLKEIKTIPRYAIRKSYTELRHTGFNHVQAKMFLKIIDNLFLKKIDRQEAIDNMALISGSVDSAANIIENVMLYSDEE